MKFTTICVLLTYSDMHACVRMLLRTIGCGEQLAVRVLSHKGACRTHPTLETALDWLLQLYWIILPIVVQI